MKLHAGLLIASLVATLPVAAFSSDSSSAGGGGMGMPVNSGVTGKVVETMTAGGYTYANLEKDGQKAWVAFPVTSVSVGQQMGFTGCTPMMDFESKALNRTFPLIMFCGQPLSQTATELLSRKSTGSSGNVPVSTEKIVVERAKGGNAYSVADIYAKKDELDKKTVVVKGKVMKVSRAIMGKNWIHLQDGTGTVFEKNNDLVVTTNDLPNVGDIVTVTGTAAKGKDFGSGYKYDVMLELSTVQQ